VHRPTISYDRPVTADDSTPSDGELEAQLAELTEERRELFARLATVESERADYTLELFTMAAHELSTPLQSLLLSTDLMLSRAGETPAGEWLAGHLETQRRTLLRLSTLLRSWLLAPQLRAGTLPVQREPFDLADLVRELVARQEDELSWAHCEVALQLQSICGSWDRLRLDTVLCNLLDNAVKYGAGKPIALATRREADVAILTVCDTGIGIAKADQERIFQRFERAAGPTRVPGFGVGLWMTRALLRDIGGVITVESTPGLGARFTVRLPITP
jgi:signal transduction histidine kinase